MHKAFTKSLLYAFIFTILSPFLGHLRYPYGDNQLPPIWLQLILLFVVSFITTFCLYSLFFWLGSLFKKRKGKNN